jgi:asparagine synthase (glutamine-hydrolysing)
MILGEGGRILKEQERESASWALGHVRLAILDLSDTGRQPMVSADGSCALVYNGEVYNYLELRKELEKLGARFQGSSDSEVVLAAFRQWGEACVTRFNGMFAFVVVDLAAMKVFAARDRLGVKPLYLWRNNGCTVLCSEIKQLLDVPGFTPRTNGQQLVDFLVDGVLNHEPDQCCFEGVYPLPPAQSVSFDLARPSKPGVRSKYWTPRTQSPWENWEVAVEKTGELLKDAVRVRLRSDVPVGSCLSGGLDSSTIVGLVSRDSGLRMKTFSSCFPGAPFDETPYVDAVTRHCGTDATYVFPVERELIREIDLLALHQDEPFTTPSVYAQWSVMKAAASAGVRVILDGQGGDELLCGYKKYAWFRLMNLLKGGRIVEASRFFTSLAMRGDRGIFNLTSGRRYLPAFLRSRISGVTSLLREPWRKLTRPVWSARMKRADSPRRHQWADLTQWSLPLLLRYEDRNSMAHGVETRLPFLDYRLVEHFLNLKDAFFFKGGRTKRIVVEAVGDALPREIVNRRTKIGFETPAVAWLKGDLGGYLEKRVRRSEGLAEILDTKCAGDAFRRFRVGKVDFTHDILFRIGSASLWLDAFSAEPVLPKTGAPCLD